MGLSPWRAKPAGDGVGSRLVSLSNGTQCQLYVIQKIFRNALNRYQMINRYSILDAASASQDRSSPARSSFGRGRTRVPGHEQAASRASPARRRREPPTTGQRGAAESSSLARGRHTGTPRVGYPLGVQRTQIRAWYTRLPRPEGEQEGLCTTCTTSHS